MARSNSFLAHNSERIVLESSRIWRWLLLHSLSFLDYHVINFKKTNSNKGGVYVYCKLKILDIFTLILSPLFQTNKIKILTAVGLPGEEYSIFQKILPTGFEFPRKIISSNFDLKLCKQEVLTQLAYNKNCRIFEQTCTEVWTFQYRDTFSKMLYILINSYLGENLLENSAIFIIS